MGKKNTEDKYDLIRYYSQSQRSIIGRVAPCLDDMVRKLEVVRCCCDFSEIGLSGIPDDIVQMRILYMCSEPRSDGNTVIAIDVGQ